MTAHPTTEGHEQPDAPRTRGDVGRPLAIGAVLILVGLVAAMARTADHDLGASIGEQTWPLLVILPGLALLGFAVVMRPPDGLGFAIAGSIVTTVGMILLVQANTDTWASWAYVWLLIPGAAGLGMAGYGLLTRSGELVERGGRMAAIAGVLFVVAWWYFETVFATGAAPIDVGSWWPVALVLAGAIVMARALFGSRRRPSP